MEDLQQEKIDALKSNEHTVTIVKRTEAYEHAYHPISEDQARSRIMQIMNDRRYLEATFRSVSRDGAEGLVKAILGAAFEFKRSVSTEGSDEKIYSMKLRQMKQEIKEEARKELDKEIQDDLARGKKQAGQIKDLKADIKLNESTIEDLNKLIDAQTETIKKLNDDLPSEEELKDLDNTKSKISALEALTLSVEYKTRFIPMLSGRSICVEVNGLCSNVIKDLEIKKL